jgi:uncharacterized protein (TIGR02246 family)
MAHTPGASYALLALATLLVGCATGPSTREDVRSAVEAANEQFMQAVGRGDAGQVANLYTADAQLLPPGSPIVTGRQAIHQYWQGGFTAGLKSLVLSTVEVQAYDGAAYEAGKYAIPGEGGKMADTGKYVVIWKRDDGQWRLHRDIWNSDVR